MIRRFSYLKTALSVSMLEFRAAGMLLAQGAEGAAWVSRLPGRDAIVNNPESTPGRNGEDGTGDESEEAWWIDGGVTGASLFDRECDKAAKKIGLLYDGGS